MGYANTWELELGSFLAAASPVNIFLSAGAAGLIRRNLTPL